MMVQWNKVSSISPYLNNIQYNEGLMRVAYAESVGSLHILVVGVPIRGCDDFDLFIQFVWQRDPVSPSICFGSKEL